MLVKVLIADDDASVIELLREVFNSLSSELKSEILVEEANNGFRALKLITSFMPDIVVLDQGLPRKTGLRVLAELKSITTKDYHPKVIIITSQHSKELLRGVLALGACDFILKPFEVGFVKNKLRAHLEPIVQSRIEEDVPTSSDEFFLKEESGVVLVEYCGTLTQNTLVKFCSKLPEIRARQKQNVLLDFRGSPGPFSSDLLEEFLYAAKNHGLSLKFLVPEIGSELISHSLLRRTIAKSKVGAFS